MSPTRSTWCASLGVVAAAAWIVFGHPVPVHAQTPPAAEESLTSEDCVLLRNGNVLSGAIRRTEDGYVVTRQGVTVHVPGYQVLVVCEDLAAAYEHQRSLIPPGQVIPHLQLAEWCLQHGLWDAARREIERAAEREPAHPRLAVLERRLAVALQPTSPGVSRSAITRPEPADPARPAMTTAPPSSDSPAAGLALANRASLPEETMEKFRRRIQPLLLNSCTTSGCHRSGGNESFVLDRRALWRDAPHTLTTRNLARTLKYVDFDAPQESPLVTAAVNMHASNLKSPPISPESASFELLQDWLLYISGSQPEEAPASEVATPPPAEAAEEQPGESDDVEISDEELDALLYGDQQQDLVQRHVQRGLRPAAPRTQDPFDPREFNDRFSPRSRAARGASAARPRVDR